MMKKYIVRVEYTDSHDLVWLVKAKNDKDLENIMTREYCESCHLIDGYEYEQVNNRMFEKNDINLISGNWVGVEIMKNNDGKSKEAVITGTARVSTEPPTYPICPHCNGHYTKLLYGTGTGTNERNDFVLHYKCLDCGEEFDKEF